MKRSTHSGTLDRSLPSIACILVLGACAAAGPSRPAGLDPHQSSPEQRARLDALRAALAPVVEQKGTGEELLLLPMEDLYRPLDAEQRQLLDAIRTLPGADHSLGIPDVRWIRVPGQVTRSGRDTQPIPVQLLPAAVFRAYAEMNLAMRQELSRGLFVGSGYRSPAYQLYLLLSLLPYYDYSIDAARIHVNLPGASEHNRVECQGIDFVSESGVDLQYRDARAFAALPEHAWLQKNAARFGFSPEAPEDGGVAASPWHWHYGSCPQAP